MRRCYLDFYALCRCQYVSAFMIQDISICSHFNASITTKPRSEGTWALMYHCRGCSDTDACAGSIEGGEGSTDLWGLEGRGEAWCQTLLNLKVQLFQTLHSLHRNTSSNTITIPIRLVIHGQSTTCSHVPPFPIIEEGIYELDGSIRTMLELLGRVGRLSLWQDLEEKTWKLTCSVSEINSCALQIFWYDQAWKSQHSLYGRTWVKWFEIGCGFSAYQRLIKCIVMWWAWCHKNQKWAHTTMAFADLFQGMFVSRTT